MLEIPILVFGNDLDEAFVTWVCILLHRERDDALDREALALVRCCFLTQPIFLKSIQRNIDYFKIRSLSRKGGLSSIRISSRPTPDTFRFHCPWITNRESHCLNTHLHQAQSHQCTTHKHTAVPAWCHRAISIHLPLFETSISTSISTVTESRVVDSS